MNIWRNSSDRSASPWTATFGMRCWRINSTRRWTGEDGILFPVIFLLLRTVFFKEESSGAVLVFSSSCFWLTARITESSRKPFSHCWRISLSTTKPRAISPFLFANLFRWKTNKLRLDWTSKLNITTWLWALIFISSKVCRILNYLIDWLIARLIDWLLDI